MTDLAIAPPGTARLCLICRDLVQPHCRVREHATLLIEKSSIKRDSSGRIVDVVQARVSGR